MELTNAQQSAIHEITHNLQIIACAGSGKTEVITRRIAYILQRDASCKPENIVAFTFTNKAAASLKYRILKVLGEETDNAVEKMYVGTIHGFCNYLLSEESVGFGKKILDTVKNHLFVVRYNKECGMSDLKLDPYPRNVNLFLDCIDKMIDDFENADAWTQEQRDVLNKYIDCLYRHGYINYSLLIFETLRQVEENQKAKELIENIKYLVVDEYQDIDDLQEKIIRRIADCGANICVVGDDDQTIYQFRGSNADNMISFSDRYPNVRQVRLEQNFRCAPGIVDVANSVIRHNSRRIKKEMISENTDLNSEIEARGYYSKGDEYDAIAEHITGLHSTGIRYRDIAILARKGKIIAPLATALNQASIPFDTDSAELFFKGDYFGRFVTTIELLSDCNKPKLYECWQDLVDGEKFNSGFKYLRSSARDGRIRMSEALRGFCEKTEFLNEDAVDLEIRQMDLDGICQILDDYDEIYGDWQLSARINGLLKFLGTRAADEYKYHNFRQKDPDDDSVQIMTVHKAKGLEFHTVFLPELMNREFPVSNIGGKKYWHVLGGTFEENKNKYQSDIEDERKLFYVAVTRAKQNLYLTYELSNQPLSCFVREAADSQYLRIDASDFDVDPLKSETGFLCDSSGPRLVNEENEAHRQEREYWATVRYARSQLYEYYGTACHFCPGAFGDLESIKRMSPDELLREASRNGLI